MGRDPPEIPRQEEIAPAAAVTPWAEVVREEPIAKEILRSDEKPISVQQPFPTEKIEGLADDLAEVSGTLRRMSDSLALLQRTVSDLKAEVGSLRNDMALLRDKPSTEPELKDMKEFKELKREQKEISNLLKDIAGILNALKERKSWFKF